MNSLLKWAGKQTEPVTNDAMKPLAKMMKELVNDPVVVSYHLWGWLNSNLIDDAWDIFDGAEMEDGFEVWRLLNVDVTQKTLAERLDLEDVVLTPPRVQDVSQIPQALVRWDAAHKEYVGVGGVSLPPDKKVGAIMRILPKEVKERIMWDHPQFLESPEALRKWLKEKTKQLTKGSYGPSRRGVNLLDEDLDGGAELEDELNALGDVPDGELLAYVRKF
jgi:hypothetical protein